MNKKLRLIEEEGARYGMRLNKGKCELLCMGYSDEGGRRRPDVQEDLQ